MQGIGLEKYDISAHIKFAEAYKAKLDAGWAKIAPELEEAGIVGKALESRKELFYTWLKSTEV